MDELEKQQRQTWAEMQAIVDAVKLGNRSLTANESKRLEELRATDDELKEKIKVAKAREAQLNDAAARVQQADQPTGRRTQPDAVGVPHITVTDAALSDPRRGFRDHRDFLSAVHAAGRTGRVDQRLRPLVSASQLTAGSDEHGTYSDPYGGFFVPTAFSPETLRIDPEGDPMASLVRRIPMATPSISFNARVDKDHSTSVSGGLRVYRRKETQTVTASRMEHEQVELKTNALFGVAYASEELLERSLVSFIALLDAGFSDEFNAKLISERLSGTGVGEMEGVLNAGCLIEVAAEGGQAADTILKENIDQMRTRIWRYSSAVWLANHGTLPALMSLVHVIGTSGTPVSYFSTDASGNATLLGRPLFFSEFMPVLGDAGDLLLANWSEYLEGTLTTQQNAESMHVRFLEHERTFKFWMENDGRSWWRSVYTPRNGPTRSPFVVLAAR